MSVEVPAGVLRAVARSARVLQRKDAMEKFRGLEGLRALRKFPEFARRQLKIVHRERGVLVPFELNWIQRQILAHELKVTRKGVQRPWFIILKYRRGGVTTLEQGLGYHHIWAHPHAAVRTLAHRTEDTRTIFEMVQRFWHEQPAQNRHKRRSAATYHIQFPGWDSKYVADTAGATAGGRGSRMDRVHLSEAAFYKDLGTLHVGLADAVKTRPYVIESTANGKSGRGEGFYRFWQAAVRGESHFIPLFFAWHHDPKNRLWHGDPELPDRVGEMTEEEERLVDRFDLELSQIAWWRDQRKALVADGRSQNAIYQEHPNDAETAFVSAGAGYYSTKLVDDAFGYCRPPLSVGDLTGGHWTENDSGWSYPEWVLRDVEHGRLRIWEEPQAGSLYVLGCDPAEGVGADESAIVCLNAETGEQAFAWAWNRVSPDELGASVVAGPEGLGRLWRSSKTAYPAFFVCERENHGHSVLASALRIGKYPEKCVYHEVQETHDGSPTSKRAGWRHNHVQLTNAVGRMLREGWPILRDTQTIASIQQVTNNNGSAQFSGRDLAVAAGCAVIGIQHMPRRSTIAYLGGRFIDVQSGEVPKQSRPAVSFDDSKPDSLE